MTKDEVDMLERAKKFAAIYDDLAVKSEIDTEYWRYAGTAMLLREMSDKIKELENGKTMDLWGNQTSGAIAS